MGIVLPFKSRVMGPLLDLVYPCFRKNAIVACKIVSLIVALI